MSNWAQSQLAATHNRNRDLESDGGSGAVPMSAGAFPPFVYRNSPPNAQKNASMDQEYPSQKYTHAGFRNRASGHHQSLREILSEMEETLRMHTLLLNRVTADVVQSRVK